MDLRIYLEILWRRKWTIVLTTIIATVAVLAGISLMTPTYTATATLRVSPRGEVDFGAVAYSERLMNTYAHIVQSGPTMTLLAERLGLSDLPKVNVRFPDNSELMQVEVESTDPVLAANAANSLVSILMDQIASSRTGRSSIVTFTDPATVPQEPAGLDPGILIALGLIAGLMGGAGLAFLFEHMDTRLYTTRRIEEVTALPSLGNIPAARPWQRKLAFIDDSREAEAFRHLRTSIFTLGHENRVQTLLITSSEPSEGKSTIAANVAAAIGQSMQRVIVVDGDMRLPKLHKLFRLSNTIGLSTVLKQEIALEEAIQAHSTLGVDVLTSGPRPERPAELLASPQMGEVMQDLVQQYDMVVIDTPSLLAVTDAAILIPTVDAVLFVVERTHVRQAAVESAYKQLLGVKPKTVGLVVNRAERNGSYYYYGRGKKR
jgi:succinoglycan biosynthesis transport protein ExoP